LKFSYLWYQNVYIDKTKSDLLDAMRTLLLALLMIGQAASASVIYTYTQTFRTHDLDFPGWVDVTDGFTLKLPNYLSQGTTFIPYDQMISCTGQPFSWGLACGGAEFVLTPQTARVTFYLRDTVTGMYSTDTHFSVYDLASFDTDGDYTAELGNSNGGIAQLHVEDPPDDPAGTPEPAALALTGVGLLGLALTRRYRKPVRESVTGRSDIS
jgi:hypothetical protein